MVILRSQNKIIDFYDFRPGLVPLTLPYLKADMLCANKNVRNEYNQNQPLTLLAWGPPLVVRI